MWINIQNYCINFDNVLTYYSKKNVLYIVTLLDKHIPYFYSTPEKVSRVKDYLDFKLKVDHSLED